MSNIGPVGPSTHAAPLAQPDPARRESASNAQSDAMLRNVVGQFAQSALQSAAANPQAAMQSFAADAPKLLLGLIPVVGPFILLAQAFGKVAEFAGTSTPRHEAGAPVIPNKAPPMPGQPKKADEKDGEARATWKEEVSLEHTERGSFGDARNGGSGSVTARADAGVRADAVATTTATGGRAAAGVRGEAGVAVNARGELHGDAGTVSGEANAYARAYAEAKGVAQVDLTSGASVCGTASTGAEAGADAQVCAQTAPLVKLGGYNLTAGASGNGYAVSGAGASCTAEATATFNPPEVVGQIGGRAFAGARAGAHASIGTGPFKLDVGIDARAGAGIEYGGSFSFKDGKLELKGFAGIAAAVGLGTNFNLSIDFNELGAMVAGIFTQVAMDAPPGSPGQAAAAGIADFVKLATPFVAKAAEQYANHDLLNGQGAFKEEVTGQTKRDDPSLESLPQKERDAIQERDLARQRDQLAADQKRFGAGSRSSLDRSIV